MRGAWAGEQLPNLWGLFHDALLDIAGCQAKIIALLQAMKELPDFDLTGRLLNGPLQDQSQCLWRDLPGFGHMWCDLVWWSRGNRWRDQGVSGIAPATRASIVSIAEVEARLLVTDIVDTLYYGYQRLCDTLED